MPKPGASCLFKISVKAFSFVNAAVLHQGSGRTKLMEPYLAFVSPGRVQPSYKYSSKMTSHKGTLNLYDMLWDLDCNIHSAHRSDGVEWNREKCKSG